MKGIKLFCLLPLIFIIPLVSCRSSKGAYLSKKYAPTQLKQDAALFRDVTMAMHPVIGIYNSREYYNAAFDKLIKSFSDSLTEKQFRIKLKLLVDELHCGHTEAIASRGSLAEAKKLTQNYCPYLFMPLRDTVFMVAALNKKTDTLIRKGSIITRINGVSTDSMLRYCKRFLSSDGFNTTSKDHYIQWNFNNFFLALFGRPDTFNIEYSTGREIRKAKFAAARLNSLPPVSFTPKSDSNFVRFKKAKIRYKYLDQDRNTMLVKVERFSARKYLKAYRKIFRLIKHNEVQNLVIDLRNNGGGSIANSYRLLSYLIDKETTQTFITAHRRYPYGKHTRGNFWFPVTRFVMKVFGNYHKKNDTDYFELKIKPVKRNHFNGKVIVLINGGSFSASSLVAAYLKQSRRAVFVGRETGGAMEGCNAGIMPYYILPNTRVRIRMPAFRVRHDVCSNITGHGIMPDAEIFYTITDILQRKDPELQKVRDLLGQK